MGRAVQGSGPRAGDVWDIDGEGSCQPTAPASEQGPWSALGQEGGGSRFRSEIPVYLGQQEEVVPGLGGRYPLLGPRFLGLVVVECCVCPIP